MIGFIGAGNMAEAIIGGIIKAGLYSPEQIIVSDVRPERLDYLKNKMSINVTSNNKEIAERATTLVFSVKPQNINDVLKDLDDKITGDHLCISILAGVKTSLFENNLKCDKPRIIRVMPNTPALIQCGASALCKGNFAKDEDLEVAESIFNSVGISVIVEEHLIDAVTGVSGSGPAYIFLFIENLIKAGVELGLSEEVAEILTKQMVLGAARMAMESEKTPEELRKAVTSPGGTTQAALEYFESKGFSDILIGGVKRATERSKELGQ